MGFTTEQFARAFGMDAEESRPDSHVWGAVTHVNGDGTVQVLLSGSQVTARAASLYNAAIGDRVLCAMSGGKLTALGSIANSAGAVDAITGVVVPYAGQTAPIGWLVCDGSEFPRSVFPELFAVIGTLYGDGDGSSTFNIPDMRGAFALGVSGEHALASKGGEEEHTLTEAEMPSHSHSYSGDPFTNSGGGSGNTNLNGAYGAYYPGHWFSINATGGSQPHNNMPPFTALNYIINAGRDTRYIVFSIDIESGLLSADNDKAAGATASLDARGRLLITG